MKTVATNRRVRFDYEILETVEAGLILSGPEVKSCRQGKVNIAGSYVSMRGKNAVLQNATIAAYPFARQEGYEPISDRILLLNKSEGERMKRALQEKGVTVIPLEVRAGKFIKILLGFGRGRKRHDKRDRIRDRETARRLRQGKE